MTYLTEVRRLAEQQVVRLTFDDGHVADFANDYLRGYCPCAMCQGHAVGPVRFQAPAKPVTPTGIEPVGNYAISFRWSDGHSTGIYRFEFLRQICPCKDCRSTREETAGSSPT